MLALRPGCEQCDRDLPPDSPVAMICTYECTFCSDCATQVLQDVCPNCGGELVRRPVRPREKLAGSPPSVTRVFNPLQGERSQRHAAMVARYRDIDPKLR
jgi:hypothetical protein